SAIERFDAQDSREMPPDLAPALTLVGTGKHRAAIGPKVEPHRLALVTRHGLPKNGEVAGFLWQSIAHGLPGLAAVSLTPYGRSSTRRKTACHVTIQRHSPDGFRISWMNANWKSES